MKVNTSDQKSSATRVVRFTEIFPRVFSFHPMTQAENYRAWYSQNELKGFKTRAIVKTRSMILTKKDGGKIGRFRGLEHHVSFRRLNQKRIAIRAVMEIQKQLRHREVDTPLDSSTVLALAIRKLTLPARILAFSVGSYDAFKAYEVYRSADVLDPCWYPLAAQSIHTRKRTVSAIQSAKSSRREESVFEHVGIHGTARKNERTYLPRVSKSA